MVINLKLTGIWVKMFAIYPFVGGSSTTHKWNLKDPRDLDVAFRLTFFGGWIHSLTGAKPNGTNSYATTQFIPSIHLTMANGSAHYYSRTNTTELTTNNVNGIVIGCRSGAANNTFQLTIRRNNDNNTNFFFSANGTNTNNLARFTDTDGSGFYSGNLLGNNSNIYRNGVNSTTSFVSLTRATPNVQLFLGGTNNKDLNMSDPTLKESAFAAIGVSLTNTENVDFYNTVQTFQTTLNRNV